MAQMSLSVGACIIFFHVKFRNMPSLELSKMNDWEAYLDLEIRNFRISTEK